MQYIRREKLLTVVRITGPSHNLLGLELINEPQADVKIEGLEDKEMQTLNATIFDADIIKREVIAGISEANTEYNTSYSVSHIQYVKSDSPPVTTYKFLAYSIVKRLASSENFEGSV